MGLDIYLENLTEPKKQHLTLKEFNLLDTTDSFEVPTPTSLPHINPKFLIHVCDFQSTDWNKIYQTILEKHNFNLNAPGIKMDTLQFFRTNEEYTLYRSKDALSGDHLFSPDPIPDKESIDAFNLKYSGDFFACLDLVKTFPFLTDPSPQIFIHTHEAAYQRKGVDSEFYELFTNCEPCFDLATVVCAREYVNDPEYWDSEFIKKFTPGGSYVMAWW